MAAARSSVDWAAACVADDVFGVKVFPERMSSVMLRAEGEVAEGRHRAVTIPAKEA